MARTVSWARHHRLASFFTLAYVVGWAPWPIAAAGLLPAQASSFPFTPVPADAHAPRTSR